MKKWLVVIVIFCLGACTVGQMGRSSSQIILPAGTYEDTLRLLYLLPSSQWPQPDIDSGVVWTELGILPDSPLKPYTDSLKSMIELGKTLFFDPRLSGSNQISCSSCHIPELSWADGRERSVGHDHQENNRNSPSLLNVWHKKTLFWDGRSHSLEDQAFSPINNEREMASDMPEVVSKLRKIEGYRQLFETAYGSAGIDPDRITEALAVFQRTLVSRKADFDRFMRGDTMAISDGAVRGMHLFRTKARCMNCHNGPLLTDNSFHNMGLTYYQRKYEDLGRYMFTRNPEDVGRFQTPSLRDVMRTAPWMHNGLFDDMMGILNMYDAGMPVIKPKAHQLEDPLFPKNDPILRKLNLSKQDKEDIIAFLETITARPMRVVKPELPR